MDKRRKKLNTICTVLVGTGVVLGVLAMGSIPGERTPTSRLISGSIANRALAESMESESSTEATNDIQVELIVPPVLVIPENNSSSRTPVKLMLKITNNLQVPIRFPMFDPLVMLFLKMRDTTGTYLRSGAFRGMLLNSERYDCPVAMPDQTVTFAIDSELFWRDNKLVLESQDRLGGVWYFEDVRPGTYQMQAKYTGRRTTAFCDNPGENEPRLTEGIWTGKATSPFVEFQVVEHY